MSWVDISIIIVVLINAFYGLHKGFIITAFNLAGYILAGIIAKVYYPVVAGIIKNNPSFFSKINSFVTNKVHMMIDSIDKPNSMSSILNSFRLPEIMQKGIIESSQIQSQMDNLGGSFGNFISTTFTDIFINIISIIIVFILARIILAVIIRLLDSISKLPILNEFNKISGLILGIAKGVLIIYIIFAILTPIIMVSPEGVVAEYTYNSKLGEYFYSNNIIINLLRDNGLIG